MANIVLNTRIQLRNDTLENWNTNDPILSKGELGVEIDTSKIKIGDGINNWSDLKYASSQPAILNDDDPSTTDYGHDIGSIWINTTSEKAFLLYDNTANDALWKQIIDEEDIENLPIGDMFKSQFATNAKSDSGYVDSAIKADKLTTGRTFSLTGDVSATEVTFDGGGNVALSTVLADVVTAGTYIKIDVNSKGLVTGYQTLLATDIPTLTMAKISDAGTSATQDIGLNAGDVVGVESNGKINDALLPSIAINEIHEVGNEAAMLALTANKSDLAIRSDINKSFILKQMPASTLSNWIELKTPTDVVLSVNGKIGAITLTTSDISEGTNLYYTEARATANFESNFSEMESTDLADSETLLRTTDSYTFNGGSSGGF